MVEGLIALNVKNKVYNRKKEIKGVHEKRQLCISKNFLTLLFSNLGFVREQLSGKLSYTNFN